MPAFNVKDLAAGLVFAALGLAFFAGALMLDVGTALKMGPGYFPLVLSGLMVLLGAVIAFRAFAAPPEPFGPVPWRGLVLILAAPVVFGATVLGLGLVAALPPAVFVAAYASKRSTLPVAIALVAGLTVFCVLVFSYGLGLPLRLIGPWLRF